MVFFVINILIFGNRLNESVEFAGGKKQYETRPFFLLVRDKSLEWLFLSRIILTTSSSWAEVFLGITVSSPARLLKSIKNR